MPPLLVGVWRPETRLSLTAVASAHGNEVKPTLAALKIVVLKGCVVTADALQPPSGDGRCGARAGRR